MKETIWTICLLVVVAVAAFIGGVYAGGKDAQYEHEVGPYTVEVRAPDACAVEVPNNIHILTVECP